MTIDYEYIQKFLAVAQENGVPDFQLRQQEFSEFFDPTDQTKLKTLLYYLELLNDLGCIESLGGGSLGIERYGGGIYKPHHIPLRLTATGHQFAKDLNKPGILETFKQTLIDQGPKGAMKLVTSICSKLIDKKVSDLELD